MPDVKNWWDKPWTEVVSDWWKSYPWGALGRESWKTLRGMRATRQKGETGWPSFRDILYGKQTRPTAKPTAKPALTSYYGDTTSMPEWWTIPPTTGQGAWTAPAETARLQAATRNLQRQMPFAPQLRTDEMTADELATYYNELLEWQSRIAQPILSPEESYGFGANKYLYATGATGPGRTGGGSWSPQAQQNIINAQMYGTALPEGSPEALQAAGIYGGTGARQIQEYYLPRWENALRWLNEVAMFRPKEVATFKRKAPAFDEDVLVPARQEVQQMAWATAQPEWANLRQQYTKAIIDTYGFRLWGIYQSAIEGEELPPTFLEWFGSTPEAQGYWQLEKRQEYEVKEREKREAELRHRLPRIRPRRQR